MTKTLRRISQILFLGLFLYIVFSATSRGLAIRNPFMKIDPLVAIATMLATRTMIHALFASVIILVSALLLGRVFCGWICPMGSVLDLSDKLFYRKPRRKDVQYRNLKFFILAGLIVTALFSMQAVYMLDPLSLLTRSIVLVFVAPVQMLLRTLKDLADAHAGGSGILASTSYFLSFKLGAWNFVAADQMFFRESLVFFAVFAVIIGLNSISRRFWCRNLCPLGALLGLFSRVPLLKRAVSTECIECGKCTRNCKMAAIPANPHLTRSVECIECFNCVPICPTSAESFRIRPKPEIRPETNIDLSRRQLLQGAAMGLAFAALVKVDPTNKYSRQVANVKLSSPALIRPPGSLPETAFINQCVRCGACMKACPSNGLQPALEEAGVEGLWTPVLVPKIGPCVQKCNACGSVCPTDAIRRFTFEEKSSLQIGIAMIDRSHCLAWGEQQECLTCNEYCSYQAVEVKKVNGVGVPVIDKAKCVGCGACENACPIQPVAAIRVFSMGDKRNEHGQDSSVKYY